jgi:spore germination protein KC
MKRIRRILHLTLLLVCAQLLLTGCWNRKEPNEIDYVTAVGVDVTKEGQLTLTIQSPSLEALKTKEGGNKEQVRSVSVTGQTSFEAIRNYISAAGKKLFWGHTQIYMIGEEAAKGGVDRFLDFFSMDPELRGTSQMAVVKGNAKDVIESKSRFASQPANYLRELMRNASLNGNVSSVTFAEFNRMEAEPAGSQPYLPLMQLMEQDTYDRTVTGLETKSSKKNAQSSIVYANGTAVFKGTKLVGYLNEKETRGLLWCSGKLKSTIVTVPCGDGCMTSLELVGAAKADKKVVMSDNQAHFKVKIKANLNIADRSRNRRITDEAFIQQLEKGFNEAVQEEVEAAFAKSAKKLHSDVLAFGNALSDHNPKLWKKLMPDWEDNISPHAELEVEVEGKIRRTSRTLYSPWAKSKNDE